MTRFTPYFERRHFLVERAIAILALLNLVLVFFNLSYIPFRDFYLQTIPALTQRYDAVKGIEPQPETEHYLAQVETLKEEIVANEVRSPQVENQLERLQQLSIQLLEDNPFAGANKSRSLEQIKNTLRQRTEKPLARESFLTFWSQDYLETNWQEEIAFWDTEIRPLIETNYYRRSDRFGRYVDYFWLIDLPFVLIFAGDLLVRLVSIKRRHPELNWLEATLRRWYDLFLVLPFWQTWRVLPVAIRLFHVDLLNLEPVRAEIHRDLLIGLTAELTEMVGIKVIDQMQRSLQEKDALQKLFNPHRDRPYYDINGKSEVSAIADRLIDIGLYDVFPQIKPDIEDLIRRSLDRSFKQLPIYQQLSHIPGLDRLPVQITQNLTKSLSEVTYNSLVNIVEDPVTAKIADRLGKNFRKAIERELLHDDNVREIRFLAIDLLEEIKINYIKNIEELGIEQLMDETEQLHRRIETYAQKAQN
jgi:hypothetical protein